MPKFIGITGGSGSGKTLVAFYVEEKLGVRCLAFSLDRFYKHCPEKTLTEREQTNYDIPNAIDWDLALEVLRELKAGNKVKLPNYSFGTHLRTDQTTDIDPADYDNIVIEGILVLSQPEMAKQFDLKIYVDAKEVFCFIRRQKRDVSERERTWQSVSDQYLATVHDAFQTHTKPIKKLTDILVVTNNGTKENVNMMDVFVAIYNLSATVTLDLSNTAAMLTARMPISSTVMNDRERTKLTIAQGQFGANTTPSPTPSLNITKINGLDDESKTRSMSVGS